MLFSSAPDEALLGRVAGALAVDEAFVEKDWFVVQAIAKLLETADEEISPVFSGGTSLLKGYGLIQRFSEDIDFKLTLSSGFLASSGNQQRKRLGDFRDKLAAAWKEAGFGITRNAAGNANAFIEIEMEYPSHLPTHGSLRPHILAELSARPPKLPVRRCSVASYVSQYSGAEPEIAEVDCVDPVETAADKLSAFAWRMLARDRTSEDDDPTIVRHLHDLAMLEKVIDDGSDFAPLLRATMELDTARGGDATARLGPAERLEAMCAKLGGDPLYADEYRQFVGGMAFAGAGEIPDFEAAVAAVIRLARCLET